MSRFFASAAALKNYLSFWLTFISIVGVLAAHYTKGTDIQVLLPTLLGLYLGARTFTRTSAHMAATKDEKSDTKAIIEAVDDR